MNQSDWLFKNMLIHLKPQEKPQGTSSTDITHADCKQCADISMFFEQSVVIYTRLSTSFFIRSCLYWLNYFLFIYSLLKNKILEVIIQQTCLYLIVCNFIINVKICYVYHRIYELYILSFILFIENLSRFFKIFYSISIKFIY